MVSLNHLLMPSFLVWPVPMRYAERLLMQEHHKELVTFGLLLPEAFSAKVSENRSSAGNLINYALLAVKTGFEIKVVLNSSRSQASRRN